MLMIVGTESLVISCGTGVSVISRNRAIAAGSSSFFFP